MNRSAWLICCIVSVAFSQVSSSTPGATELGTEPEPVPWENSYSAAGYAYTVPHDVCPAHNSGMVIAGSCFSADMESNSLIYIFHLSEYGNVVWSNTYRITTSGVNIAWSISKTSTGFVLAGETGSSQNRQAFVATIDQNGGSFTSGIIDGECAVEAVQMQNCDGYIVMGQTDTEQEHSYIFVDKVNNNLSQIQWPDWSRWVNDRDPDMHSYAYCNSIVEIPSDYGPDLANHIALCFGRGYEGNAVTSMVGLLHPQGTVMTPDLEASSTGAGYF